MSELIEVFVRPPTERGRLHPRYDAEAGVLEVGSREPREWLYGADVDGNLVFDLSAERILSNFDLLIGRRRWKRRPLHWDWPAGAPAMDLGFTADAVAIKSFHLALEVRTDGNAPATISIRLGTEAELGTPVLLSSACAAFVHDSRLLGFVIRLEEGR